MFGKIKRRALIVGAVAIVAAGTLATAAVAETPTPGNTSSKANYGQVFLAKLAAILNVDPTTLENGVKQASKETVDQAVTDGKLTQAQADKAKSRVDQGQGGFGFLGKFGFGHGGWQGKPMKGFGGIGDQSVFKAAADKLGMTVQDLQSALRSGKSLSDLAEEQNVALEDVQGAMTAAAKTQLDQLVQAGKLTQEQANSMLERIQQGSWLNLGGKKQPGGRPFRHI